MKNLFWCTISDFLSYANFNCVFSKYLVVLFQHQHHSKSKIAVFDYDLNLVNVKHFDIYENFITIANKLSIDPHCIY